MTTEFAAEIERAIGGTFVRSVEVHRVLGSTNDRAREVEHPLPALVVAGRQTAGRGRGGNTWWGGEGALLFSVVLERVDIRVPDERRSQIALATGLAVRRAIVEVRPEIPVRLKWPNDLLVDDRKLAGILVEEADGRTIVGIGLNVNNALESAPESIPSIGVSLIDIVGEPTKFVDLLGAIVRALETEFGDLERNDVPIDRRWSPHCALTGRLVAVTVRDRRTEGVCEGIDQTGALLVRLEAGLERIISGTVERL